LLEEFSRIWLHRFNEVMGTKMRDRKLNSVVVVDDDLVYLQTVGLMLKKIGFDHVKMFSNACDALDWLSGNKPNLIVSDWDMPLLTGHEFLEEVRANPKILNTGNLSESYWSQAIASGVTEFLFKPFNFSEFKDSVFIAMDLAEFESETSTENKKIAC
jgi:phosphoserine phosphatase RsbU/P